MPLLGGRGAIIGTGIAPGIGRAGVIGRGRAAAGGCRGRINQWSVACPSAPRGIMLTEAGPLYRN